MSIFLSAMYTLFLALLAEKIVHVEEAATPPNVSVVCFIRPHNYSRIVPLLLLLLVDWICFGLIFQQGGREPLGVSEVLLLALYTPGLICLCAACLWSLETDRRYYIFAAAYHLLVVFAECVWLLFRFAETSEKQVDSRSVALLLGAVLIELILRAGLAVMYLVEWRGRTVVDERALAVIGMVLKPATLALISIDAGIASIVG
jgi:hypothetical protein